MIKLAYRTLSPFVVARISGSRVIFAGCINNRNLLCQRSQSTRHFETMKAVRVNQVKKPGKIEDLYIDDNAKKPALEDNHVLIKVFATAVNRADVLQRQGSYPPPPGVTDILGLEAAGTVDELGSGVSKWKIGDRVMTLLAGGGYAEYVSVHESLVMPVPSSISLRDAAAIPEVWLTAFQLLHVVGHLSDDESVLIHAGGSGVGTAAVQLARHTANNVKILVTAGHPDKITFAKTIGADDGYNYKEGHFTEKVLAATNGEGVNLILDCVGASYWEQNADSAKVDGRWVLYGLLGGAKLSGDLLARILRKRLTLTGTTLRARSLEYKSRLIGDFSRVVLPLFESGKLVPVVHAVFRLDQVQDAHRMMESAENSGKIILQVIKDLDSALKSDL